MMVEHEETVVEGQGKRVPNEDGLPIVTGTDSNSGGKEATDMLHPCAHLVKYFINEAWEVNREGIGSYVPVVTPIHRSRRLEQKKESLECQVGQVVSLAAKCKAILVESDPGTSINPINVLSIL